MYLIIGGNGFLGSYVIKNVLEKTSDKIIATARDISNCKLNGRLRWEKFEVTDDKDIEKLVEISSSNNEIKVVYLAAYHNPDNVEKNPKIAWNINVTALSKILNKLDHVKCLFYASTDSVYGNSVSDYHFKEGDTLNPNNIYGRQKQTAEAIVTGYGYNVVRYPFLIGPSILEHKKHFYDVIVDSIRNGKCFDMFEDSYRSSLDFDTAADILVDIMENYTEDIPKILNVSGDQDLSKYDVGVMLARHYKCDENLIRPISVNANDMIFKAPRASTTLLDNSLMKTVLGVNEVKIKFEINKGEQDAN